MKTIVVVPTIREEEIRLFLNHYIRNDVKFIVVQDGGEKPFYLGPVGGVTHYGWADIDAELGDDAWIIPRNSDCIRSFGFWKAWQAGADMIVSMDDDVRPISAHFFGNHWENLGLTVTLPAWQGTIGEAKARGVPYYNVGRKWPVAISHGLWEGVPDLDAVGQLNNLWRPPVELLNGVIGVGRYFPMCGMNLAFTREVALLMYFGLQGGDYPYDRFGDIWCGVIAKKILDRFHLAVWSGTPHVKHERASNVWANLRKEQPGYEVNEQLWQRVDGIMLTGEYLRVCYSEVSSAFQVDDDPYFRKLGNAMAIWSRLFQ